MADEIEASHRAAAARARPPAGGRALLGRVRRGRRRSSRSTPAPAAPTRRTGPRCSCACTCAGPSDRGFKTEMLEASPGEEAGLKSATFTVQRRERLRDPQGRARRPPARPAVARSTRRTAGTRRFAQVIVSPLLPEDVDVEIDEGDLRIDTYRASGAGRPAREQDRLGGAHHAHPDRDRRPVPERALAELEQADRAAHPQVAPRSSRSRSGARKSWRKSGAPRRTSASAVRSAATCSTRTSSSRITAPSYETGNTQARPRRRRSTSSSASTCSRRPRERWSSRRLSARLPALARPGAPTPRRSPFPVQDTDLQHSRRPRRRSLDQEPVGRRLRLELGDGRVRERDEDLRARRRRAA